jgi:hypothetical protein
MVNALIFFNFPIRAGASTAMSISVSSSAPTPVTAVVVAKAHVSATIATSSSGSVSVTSAASAASKENENDAVVVAQMEDSLPPIPQRPTLLQQRLYLLRGGRFTGWVEHNNAQIRAATACKAILGTAANQASYDRLKRVQSKRVVVSSGGGGNVYAPRAVQIGDPVAFLMRKHGSQGDVFVVIGIVERCFVGAVNAKREVASFSAEELVKSNFVKITCVVLKPVVATSGRVTLRYDVLAVGNTIALKKELPADLIAPVNPTTVVGDVEGQMHHDYPYTLFEEVGAELWDSNQRRVKSFPVLARATIRFSPGSSSSSSSSSSASATRARAPALPPLPYTYEEMELGVIKMLKPSGGSASASSSAAAVSAAAALPNCEHCKHGFKPSTTVYDLIGHQCLHLIAQPELFAASTCGMCGGTGSCHVTIKKNKAYARCVRYGSALGKADDLVIFSFKTAMNSTKSTPWSNGPMRCPTCPAEFPQHVWKYMMPAHYAEKHSADAMPRSASELAGVEISEAEVRGVMAKVTGKRIVHPASPAPAADAEGCVPKLTAVMIPHDYLFATVTTALGVGKIEDVGRKKAADSGTFAYEITVSHSTRVISSGGAGASSRARKRKAVQSASTEQLTLAELTTLVSAGKVKKV